MPVSGAGGLFDYLFSVTSGLPLAHSVFFNFAPASSRYRRSCPAFRIVLLANSFHFTPASFHHPHLWIIWLCLFRFFMFNSVPSRQSRC